jgi:phosphatidylserine/phosphatidylglycerophosphate/cardiolipin synthase-like enzyme
MMTWEGGASSSMGHELPRGKSNTDVSLVCSAVRIPATARTMERTTLDTDAAYPTRASHALQQPTARAPRRIRFGDALRTSLAEARARPTRPVRALKRSGLALLVLWLFTAAWHTWKPMPEGTSFAGQWHLVQDDDVELLVDSTRPGADGARVVSQTIFDAVLAAIAGAEHTLVLDYFLFNAMGGATPAHEDGGRALSGELTSALLARRAARPELRVLVVTDPINETYGGAASELLEQLRSAGIDVVVTDVGRLRDSNPFYSAAWRLALGWWDGVAEAPGWLPHPLGDASTRVPLRAWLRLLHFKANHRKVIACDDGQGGWTCIVASANPHDASSAHSNIALRVNGALALDVLAGELAVARWSGWSGWADSTRVAQNAPTTAAKVVSATPTDAAIEVRYVTEYEIERDLLEGLRAASTGDDVALAMFYLSDRDVVRALLAASDRGARVRLVLDPNKDAFGREKDGVPNRQVADELVRRSAGAIEVRWYRTSGEQFHTKLVLVRTATHTFATLGSANLTRRNLEDYNLEANIAVRATHTTSLATSLWRTFDALWSPDSDAPTAPFEAFEDRSRLRRLRYFVMETTGLSTF